MIFVISKFVLAVPSDKIAEFCERWKIQELALFGSALRDDFGPDSGLDFLAAFTDHADWGLFDHIQIQLDLSRLFGRKVDLISQRGLEQSHNWLLKEEILGTAQVLFRASEATIDAIG